MHMHAIGAPRNVTRVKFHKTYTVALEPIRGQEAQSDETRGDEGTVIERQTPNHPRMVKASPGAL
jgi:hypothetical protein